MTRPDAIPVAPLEPGVCLDGPSVAALYGKGYRLAGSERVGLSRLGRTLAHLPVTPGPTSIRLDGPLRAALDGLNGLRLVGPCGSAAAPPASSVVSRLVLPTGLRAAWGVPAVATLALGDLAVQVPVAEGPVPTVELDRGLWHAASEPATAQWLPSVQWASLGAPELAPETDASVVTRRVVTENDVRQARLRHRKIRLSPGQVVTPAAQSLAREWGVFDL